MNARPANRLRTACLLLAIVFAPGCETLRGARAEPISRASANPTYAEPPAPEPVPGGKVVAASGWGQPVDVQPMPVPRPPQYPAPQPQPYPLHKPQEVPGFRAAPPPVFADPQYRFNPTVTGRLELGPGEVPTDRVVDLMKNLDALLAQNAQLLARIKELETLGVGREQALAEAVREIDAVTADAARSRAALLAQIATLQDKIRQLEEDEIKFLEAAIKELRKIVPTGPNP